MLVPVPVQHEIAQKAPLVAYAPSRLAPGWGYRRWSYDMRDAFRGLIREDVVRMGPINTTSDEPGRTRLS